MKTIMLKTLFMTIVCYGVVTSVFAGGKADLYSIWAGMSLEELVNRGNACYSEEKLDSALLFYNMVLSQKDDKNVGQRVIALINSAGIYSLNSDTQHAYDNLIHALELCDKHGINEAYSSIYTTLGKVFQDCDDDETSNTYYRRSFEYSMKKHNWLSLLVVCNNIFYGAMSKKKLPNFYDLIDKLKSINLSSGDRDARCLSHFTNAFDHVRREMYAAAQADFDSLMHDIYPKMNNTPEQLRGNVFFFKANTYALAGDYANAISMMHRSLHISRTLNDPALSDDYITMSSFFRHTGQLDSAYYYWDKAIGGVEYTQGSMQRANKLHNMQMLYQVGKKNAEIEEIGHWYRLLYTVLWVVGVASAVVVVLLVIVYRKNKELNRRNRLLFDRYQELIKQESNRQRLTVETAGDNGGQHQEMVSAGEADSEGSGMGHGQTSGCQAVSGKYKGSSLAEGDKQRLLTSIQDVMENSNEIYEADFSVKQLSELVGSNSSYVSQVINEYYRKNFNTLLGERRVREACIRLNDRETYGNYTIEGIASELGFKSRSGFSKVFKKTTGLTPSEYAKIAADKN